MRYNFLFILTLVLLAGAIILAIIRARKSNKKQSKKTSDAIFLSNTQAIRELPEYKRARRVYRVIFACACVVLLGALGSLTVLASRPVSVSFKSNSDTDRDILLCLDVSGSMTSYDVAAIQSFLDIIDNLQGERIGVSIFTTGHANILPLNNDYEATKSFLKELTEPVQKTIGDMSFTNYKIEDYSYLTGGGTDIGIGGAGCIMSFPKLKEEKRSRSIIMITDNQNAHGEDGDDAIFKVANLAKEYGVTMYGLNPDDFSTADNQYTYSSTANDFRKAVGMTGGSYYSIYAFVTRQNSLLGSSTYNYEAQKAERFTYAKEITSAILKEEAAKHEREATPQVNDAPEIPTIVAAIFIFGFVILIGRLRL